MLNNRNINICIECGEKGAGKTTYVTQKWKQHLLIACGDPLNQVKTTGALYFALGRIYDTVIDDLWDLVRHLRKAIQDGYVLIIDEAEQIDESLLKTIVNTILSSENSTIVFTFDINCEYLYKSRIFRQLIEWDLVSSKPMANFSANAGEFNTLIEKSLPGVSEKLKAELIETSNYNFSNLKRLLWLVINRQLDHSRISEDVFAEYSYFLVEEKLSNLPNDLFNILKKSSIIGEIFQSCILESSDGFHVLGVKAYLQKLEATNMFIQSYLRDDVYQFISNKIYNGVLKSMEPHEKLESQRILLNYYMAKLYSERVGDNILEHLRQLKRLSYDLNNHEIMFFTNKKLLFRYLKIGDIAKAKKVLNDLLIFCKDHLDDNMLYLYLSYYKIRLDMNVSCYHDALDRIEDIKRSFPNGRNLYLQYYYTRSLYGIGNVDLSYQEATKLSTVLKATSSRATENQPIYALTYSLLATIQHHFGIEDYGNRYFSLALNHSKHKLKDKSFYYDILKKCDMYYAFEHSYPLLKQSISYFESVGRVYDAAEVSMNLATEMMFTDGSYIPQAETFFDKAIEVFSNIPNENLAYVQNNRALLYIIQHGDFQSALSLLESSLLVGMSAFTYMTIYMNLCMCHLNLCGHDSTEFNQAYSEFCKYHSIIKARKNATQYEDIYKGLLDILILEYSGQYRNVVDNVDLLLSNPPSRFFIPILKDIKARYSPSGISEEGYTDNFMFYEALNKYKVFLAEFRFWE